ncbi:hypothetical protein [Hansschlegelia zhihuaiae]|uniref:Uncharacterized protein n=1 Tax=Hansschlegelia zhihuaiae TaxID=405005 RepID=A0A4Q0M6P3_9HYPH|nr:hypothetical protein [Hansschlegelia zhihuaiae]RXF68533.1 hypothetical protein EK403_19765 [Hansschlegelia zhihuaiae]
MSRARLASFAVFVVAAVAGLVAFAAADSVALAFGAFFAIGLVGMWLAGRVFDRLATPEERRSDLEDRVRNPDL